MKRGRVKGLGPVVGIVAALAVSACAGRGLPPSTARIDDPGAAVEGVRSATRIGEPRRVVFRWRLRDGSRRVQGRGVARVAPEYRVRLDLFTENGETAAVAALVGADLRLPPGADARLIPPGPLLWASLGVLHPGPEAGLVEGYREGNGELLLRYDLPDDGELRYTVRNERIRRVELLRNGHVAERVSVTDHGEDGPPPRDAEYRDLAHFRELHVNVESIEDAEPYPDEIWRPGR